MRLRFKLAWQNYRVGDAITPPASLRGWLVSRGYCEPEPAPAPEPPRLAMKDNGGRISRKHRARADQTPEGERQ